MGEEGTSQSSILNLGTSANIVRLKNALLQKELIETNGKEIVLADPVFEVWFKKEMLY